TRLGLIVVVIMMGFPTAFTLMGLGMMFGFVAFYDPAAHFWDNKVFDLMVQRAFGTMTNDTLLSIPLFVLMGYIMERGALVDKLYAAAMFPGFFLALLYLVYVIGWAVLSPKVAPKLPLDQQRAPISPWVAQVSATYSRSMLPALLMAVASPGRLQHAADPSEPRITRGRLAKGL